MGVKECLEQACEATEADKLAAAGSATSAAGSATAAQLLKWEAEAWKKTCNSYANEAENVFVKLYTSDGDGTFTATDTTHYSAYHYSKKAEAGASNYRDTYETLALANAGVTNPVAGDFVLIQGAHESQYASFYNPNISGGTFNKDNPVTYGDNLFEGGQSLLADILYDGEMGNPSPVTPVLKQYNDFILKSTGTEPVHINNPSDIAEFIGNRIHKGVFFVGPMGPHLLTWGDKYEFPTAWTLDTAKVNRFFYHTSYEGKMIVTWSGAF